MFCFGMDTLRYARSLPYFPIVTCVSVIQTEYILSHDMPISVLYNAGYKSETSKSPCHLWVESMRLSWRVYPYVYECIWYRPSNNGLFSITSAARLRSSWWVCFFGMYNADNSNDSRKQHQNMKCISRVCCVGIRIDPMSIDGFFSFSLHTRNKIQSCPHIYCDFWTSSKHIVH